MLIPLFSRRPLNPHQWYTPDHELVFQCVLDRQPAHHIELGQRWQQLDTLHDSLDGVSGILPLLYHRLQASGVESPLKDRLGGVYRRSWANQQVVVSQAKQVSATLSQNQIRHAFAGDLAMAYQLYQPNHTRPIWVVRLIVDDKHLSHTMQIIQTQQSTNPFRPQKPSYNHGGRGVMGGRNPLFIINNGIMGRDDLSKWQTQTINDLPLVDRSILLVRTVANTVGCIPNVHQMIDILVALNTLNPTEQKQVIVICQQTGLNFPLWQIVVYLVDVLGKIQHQAFADQLALTIKPRYWNYLKYWLQRIKQRVR